MAFTVFSIYTVIQVYNEGDRYWKKVFNTHETIPHSDWLGLYRALATLSAK